MLRDVGKAINQWEIISLDRLHQAAFCIERFMPVASEATLARKASEHIPIIARPSLNYMAEVAVRVAAKLPQAYALRRIETLAASLPIFSAPPLGSMQELSLRLNDKAMHSHENRILASMCTTPRRQKAESYSKCRPTAHRTDADLRRWKKHAVDYLNKAAQWAGGNLCRWHKIEAQCSANPKLLALLKQQQCRAHKTFREALFEVTANSAQWSALENYCLKNPLLMREWSLWIQLQQELASELAHPSPIISPSESPASIEARPQMKPEPDMQSMETEGAFIPDSETGGTTSGRHASSICSPLRSPPHSVIL